MFQTSIALAEIAVGDRPRRDRASEQLEQERKVRFDAGKCRDCERRRRPTGELCTWCRRRIERNTARDLNKRARKGRLSIADSDQADAKLALNAFVAGFSGLDEITRRTDLTRRERAHHEGEPLSQLLLGVRSAFAIAKRRGMVDEWLDAIEQSLTRED